jgi:hypothetical protein
VNGLYEHEKEKRFYVYFCTNNMRDSRKNSLQNGDSKVFRVLKKKRFWTIKKHSLKIDQIKFKGNYDKSVGVTHLNRCLYVQSKNVV